MKNKLNRSILFILGVLFCVSGLLYTGCGSSDENALSAKDETTQAEIKFWTCSMHPQIQQPGPGQCPLCAMDLIPVKDDPGKTQAGDRSLKLSPHAIKLAEIQTATVERKYVKAEISLFGKVEYDETRLSYITAWVPGRIDRLYVDYTGVRVNKGEHLVDLYSPELITAQQELLLGLKLLKGKTGRLRKSSLKNVEASREKLKLWGLTKTQIKQLEKKGKVPDRTIIYSPISGIVVHKNGFEGDYLKTGTRIFTIADLSHVWIKFDAYESDLVWLRYGQDVDFTVNAYPGEVFKGRITFIDPILNPKTRTVKVRVNVNNTDGKLKPDMFVSALVYSEIASEGKIIDPEIVDKWICSMHPEIMKDDKGTCDLCGMPLVTTKSAGYVSTDMIKTDAPLVIPKSAPLITGKRAVVYVADKEQKGSFEGREIILGVRAGDYYIVKKGLKEGEQVVVNGNFKIDSAIQILAKPSMMNPECGVSATGHEHHSTAPVKLDMEVSKEPERYIIPDKFKEQVRALVMSYYKIHYALSRDSYKKIKPTADELKKNLALVDMKLLAHNPHLVWMEYQKKLDKFTSDISNSKDIQSARAVFDELSDTLYLVVQKFGVHGTDPVYRLFCPMANNNKGAYWLQNAKDVQNPYYGSMMFKCGSVSGTVYQVNLPATQEEKADE